MSSVQAHNAAIAATSLHPEAAIRLARALTAISAEFDAVLSEEIDRLEDLFGRLSQAEAQPRDEVRRMVDAVRRDAQSLGHPLVSEVAGSLATILGAWPQDCLPPDVIDAHLTTMRVILTDSSLKPQKAAALVANLTAAAADFVTSAKVG